MRDDTVFWLLSMTKAFTATAAMQLIEQGRMHLDQPAAEILPQLAPPKVLEGFDVAGQPILRAAKRQITCAICLRTRRVIPIRSGAM